VDSAAGGILPSRDGFAAVASGNRIVKTVELKRLRRCGIRLRRPATVPSVSWTKCQASPGTKTSRRNWH